jgi:lipopolysaccharide/colanic/teichoic acid biosynthesis glycosyltransferase
LIWIVEAFGLIALYAALTVTIERCLSFLPLPVNWRYRAAFLLGVALAFTSWLVGFLLINFLAFPFSLAGGLLGSFLGGLVVTQLSESLWENNSQPSSVIQAEVRKRHIEIIGVPPREQSSKRIFDFTVALLGLVFSAPIWLLSAFLVWFEDPGPLLFVKNSVGKGGLNFRQLKFRTMVRQAEDETGPILAAEEDERVLAVGVLLRKTALDELPQLINILKGEMSFVGPRPQRTVLVHGYLQAMPEYAERHQVSPGLSGLAQVAGDYYLTPRQKLRFDRLYIRNASLGFDLKLIMLAFLITFWFRWRRDWNGRLSRRLLRLGSRSK